MNNRTINELEYVPRKTEPDAKWAAVVSLSLGVFGLVTAEFLPVSLLTPLSADLAVSSGIAGQSITVTALVAAVAGPGVVIGTRSIDRRWTLLGLTTLLIISSTLAAFANGLFMLFASRVLLGIGLGGFWAMSAALALRLVPLEKMPRAMAIILTGVSVATVCAAPVGAWIGATLGWRSAFVAFGALPFVIGIPVIFALFRENREVAASALTSAADTAAQPATEYGMTLREALRSRHFWIMAGAFFLIAFALTAPTPNLENILKTFRFGLTEIGRIAASFGLAVIAGRIIGGWMLDRFWAPGCAFVILLLPAFGSWLFSGDSLSGGAAMVAVLCIGFGAGFEFDLLAFLISRYFGQRNYGVIYGCFYTVIACGGGLGPVVYGYAFDRMGTYSMALWSGIACILVGGALLLLLGAYPKWSRR